MRKRSSCPIASALDIIGDKWTLLIVRDLFFGKRRYSEFANAMESIPTNLLSDRLKRLCENGLAKKVKYMAHPVRYQYELTEKGEDLFRILQELAIWGHKHIKDTLNPPQPFEI